MSLILWIIFGALAGWIASLLTSTDEQQGAFGNIIVGIVGAFVGGMIVSFLGGEGVTGFNIYSLIVAIGGAVLVLFIWKSVVAKT